MDAERTPVIAGVGQVNDRPPNPADGLDPVGLMAEALRRADTDCGGLLADCDSLAVVRQIGWPQLDRVDGGLAEKLGIAPAHREQTAMPNGDSPVRLLHDAANRIGAGEARICAVVGGEALRTAGQLAALKRSEGEAKPNALRDASHRKQEGFALRHGLTVPVDVYPLYENALRDEYGQTLAEGQTESGALWAGMSEVAAQGDHAWIRQAVTAQEVVTPSESNRPIAFPYTKLQVANASVNQGAGFIMTSLAEARRRGIAEDRLVFVGHGAAAHEDTDFLRRADYRGSPGLEVSIRRTLALNGVEPADLDHVELYSCFPCVPKMARRVLGWPIDRPITVFGGLTFGGGPIGNYMSHAVACMVEALRRAPGKGLLFANGGYATHNHAILLSSTPTGACFPQDYDFQAEADDLRTKVPPIDEEYAGNVTLETYTVHYARDGSPRFATIVACTPQGARTLAIVPSADHDAIKRLERADRALFRSTGTITRPAGEPGVWRFSGVMPGGL